MTRRKKVYVIFNVKKQSASSTKLKKKKLLISQENKAVKRLWADIKVKKKSFRALIDSEASRNFLHYYVINSLKIQTQSQKSFKIIQTDETHSQQELICIKIEVNVIIHEKRQTMIFNILEKYKYTMILKLSWLQKANFQIDWINHKLCFIDKTYEIIDQSKMCLPKHELWNHEITLLLKKSLT